MPENGWGGKLLLNRKIVVLADGAVGGGQQSLVFFVGQARFQESQLGGQGADGVAQHVGEAAVIQIGPMEVGMGPAPDDFTGNPDHDGIRRHRLDHHGVGADPASLPDFKSPQNFGARPHHDAVPKRGVPLALVPAGAAQGDPLIERDVGADFRRLTDDDAHAVVDEKSGADDRPRVDFNAGPGPGDLGQKPRRSFEPPPPESVGEPVDPHRVQPGVAEDHFQPVSGRRVPGHDGEQIPAKGLKH